MLRLPAVAGRFYPSDAIELTRAIREYTAWPAGSTTPSTRTGEPLRRVKACLVPHAGYIYSGHVTGAVLKRILLPRRIILLGVRHRPHGAPAAILTNGAWRTPLGDVPIDERLARSLLDKSPVLQEDEVAHHGEHSLEVQLPFLQVLAPGCKFVPIALAMLPFEQLIQLGQAIASVLAAPTEPVLLLATSDLNHYQDDATTREKDRKAIDHMLALDSRGLYDTCHREAISMCGLAAAVTMLAALGHLGAKRAELVRYATSADISGNRSAVVGYAGMLFD